MAMGCGAKCSKIMLIVFNIIFWLSGCAILAVGIWLRVDPNMVSLQKLISLNPDDTTLDTAAYVLIGVGAFVFLVGFCGCCGALKESKFMLGVYIACLVIVMIAEIAAGVVVAIYQPQVVDGLSDSLTNNLKNHYVNGSVIAAGWDFVQLTFTCCGYNGYRDYVNSAYYNKSKVLGIATRPVPDTCCTLKNGTNINDHDYVNEPLCIIAAKLPATTSKFLNRNGCYDEIFKWINANLPIVIGVGVGIACLELFGLVFAVCLCRAVGKDD